MVSGRILQGSVGLLLLSYVCWQFFARKSGQARSSWAVGSIAGLGAGVLGTAISFDGPPAGAYAPLVRMGSQGIAGNAWRVFCPAQPDILLASGMVRAVYRADTHLCPVRFSACVLGVLCAFPVVRRVRVEIFRRFLMAVVAAGELVCLWNFSGMRLAAYAGAAALHLVSGSSLRPWHHFRSHPDVSRAALRSAPSLL